MGLQAIAVCKYILRIYLFISLLLYYRGEVYQSLLINYEGVIKIKLKDKYTHIIQYDIEQLKQLHEAEGSTDYPELKRILNNDRHFRFIGQVLNYALSRQGFIYQGEASFYLSMEYLHQAVADYSNKTLPNNKIHFFCFAELWHKINKEDPTTEADEKVKHFWNKINKDINPKQATNIYSIPLWTEEKLQQIEQNLAKLRAIGLTPSNTTYRRAKARYLDTTKVYTNIKHPDMNYLKPDITKIFKALEKIINLKGYARKQDLYKEITLDIRNKTKNEKRINYIWSIYLWAIKGLYNYKTPTDEERKRYNLTSGGYIITPLKGGYIPKFEDLL